MQHFELKGQLRQVGNKATIKAFRRQGLVPCNLYGAGIENILFTVNAKDLKGLINTPYSHIVDLNLDGTKYTAILHELQFHPVEDLCLHVDFLSVSEDKPISISVPVKVSGHSKGVPLELAQPPSELSIDIGCFYDSPEEWLLGAMASGARGILGALCDDCMGDVDIPAGGRDPMGTLENVQISVHRTYSLRRELEAIKDGLHDFLKDERNAPHEALVLCANWETYAPIIDAVFPSMPENAGYLPITMGGIAGSTPLIQSFEKLLEFRKNRFEVSAVFELLDVPAIRSKYGLDENAVDVLRDMTRKANIHWGRDDNDVAHILKLDKPDGPYPFTWQRGLDRLTAELLYGFPENDELLLTVGDIPGQLHPSGHVEGDRAKNVAALWSLVENLTKIRREIVQGKMAAPEKLQERFLDIVDTFYVEDDDNSSELNRIRTAIHSVAENMQAAGLKDAEIEVEVFIQAIQEAINSQMPGRRTPNDAVQFAPLNAYTATPHKFIWICGLTQYSLQQR